jgi:hypothetical protein
MEIKVNSNQQKKVNEFIEKHKELFILKNKKSNSTAFGKYLGNIDRNNILVMFDTEQPTHFAFCFDSNDNIIEVYDVSIGEKRIY